MKKILIACALAFSLAACAAIPNPFKTNNLYEIEASVGIARAAAVGYFSLRQCRKGEIISATNVCAKRSVKLQIQTADRNLEAALLAARAFVKNNPTVDPTSVITVVRAALSVFQTIASENNIRIGG